MSMQKFDLLLGKVDADGELVENVQTENRWRGEEITFLTEIEALGYANGGDGLLRDGGGAPLTVEFRSLAGNLEPYKSAAAGYWRALGVSVDEQVIPQQRANDGEYRATFPGFEVLSQPNDTAGLPLLHSRFTRLPENNFTGSNFSRMVAPAFDALLDRWQTTISRAERIQVLGEILYEISDRLNVMPLVYGVRPIAISNRMQNVAVGTTLEASQAWNAQAWDVRCGAATRVLMKNDWLCILMTLWNCLPSKRLPRF
jgi:ABC-type transport system substrate-binding protein